MEVTHSSVEGNIVGKENKIFGLGSEHGSNAGNSEVEFVMRNLPPVFRSNGKFEKFDPERIMASLMAETSISEEKAREVTWEFVIKLLNSEFSMVTAPFIREQVCSILFQKKPKWRFEYTRLGMPYRDFEKICNGHFDRYTSEAEIDRSLDRIFSELDKETIVEIVRRMVKDYIGVRNRIRDDDQKP